MTSQAQELAVVCGAIFAVLFAIAVLAYVEMRRRRWYDGYLRSCRQRRTAEFVERIRRHGGAVADVESEEEGSDAA